MSDKKVSVYDITFEHSIIPTLIWNNDVTLRFVNKATVDFFEAKDKNEIIENFKKFNSQKQFNLSDSDINYKIMVKKAFISGFEEFVWTHLNKSNEPIYTKVSLKLIKDENNEDVLIGFIIDLSSEMIGYKETKKHEEYFINTLSKTTFINSVFDVLEEISFYWDLRTDFIKFFGTGLEDSFVENKAVKLSEFYNSVDLVYKEDKELFEKMMLDAKSGIMQPYEIRFNKKNKEAIYYRIKYNVIFDKNNRPLAVVGFVSNIDSEKNLELKAQTDLLTGCSNKITAETLIADHLNLRPSKDGVLYIIDIDNFKAVNDNLGHHFGDMVLKDVATNLRRCFRQDDVIGRIGGDEFLVLAKNLDDEKIIIERAQDILSAFTNEYKGGNKSYKVSASIGIAKAIEHGENFEELYEAADKALYQSKLKGKDCYTIYTDELSDGTMSNHTILENAGRLAESYFDSDIISDVFELMFETKDFNSAINMALKWIGQKYNADRSYIFESHDDGVTYDNTYEWCKEGINPEIDNLKDITAEMLDDFFKYADKEGIVYSNDLTVLKADGAFELMDDQDIKSFLHSQIKENDKVYLFLGLDDCTAPRIWSPKEINSLKYLSKILSIFLVYRNRDNK